jgi:hypothetical protein
LFSILVVLEKFLKYVISLGFETKPDYEYCRKLFRQGLREAGYKDDGRLQLDSEPIAFPPRYRKVIHGTGIIDFLPQENGILTVGFVLKFVLCCYRRL